VELAMSTIYESERARVVLGDARDVLAKMPKESVDLVVVDPPYGVEWRSNLRSERFDAMEGDGVNERDGVREILEHSVRLVGQQRHLYVFGPADVLDGLKISAPVELVWDKIKNGAGDLSAPWGPAHERINFMVSRYRHGGKAGMDGGPPARLRKGSVLRAMPRTGRKVRHPSEKPVALLCELIESSSKADELVLDPCAGSGSTGVAALLRGRRTLVVESHEPYAELAASRIRATEALMAGAAML
jgi:DNA modification methylase